ncbi:ABC transporter substrate-binding protein [Roseomonas elaeocarpi]|uniref:ABC transporter substrate-binding protein n=1 Tax=Roseomonas elaeocarpi TaxID=907779 RepID=A0ABV6JLS1_9PROT
MKRRNVLLGLGALGSLPGVGRARAQATAKTISGGFDVGPGGLPGNFNPLAATAGFTWFSLYLEPLITYDETLSKVVGALAERWEVGTELTSYTFHLAEAKWHDGQPFTSADVAFTLGLARNGASGSVFAGRLSTVDRVETPDARTVIIRLSRPNASMTDTLSRLMILPQHALSAVPVAELPRNSWWSTSPVGTGPFRFSRYVSGQYVELLANPDYRGGAPRVGRVVNRYFENTAGAVAALRSGEIQFSYVEADDLPNFKGDNRFRIIEGSSYVVNYLGFNAEVPLWKDLRVRQAVMHAIDRAAIVTSLYGGAATVANCAYVAPQLVPSGLDTYGYDPDKAQALLRAAGWNRINGDKPVTVLTYYTNALAANVLAAIQSMLAQVGINVVPRAVDVPTYNSIVYATGKTDPSQFPLIYAGLQDGPDPSNINVGLNTSEIPPAGANVLRIDMPPLTEALNAALAEIDPARRTDRYRDVCRTMNANLPWGTLWVANRYGVASTRLKDFVWTPAPGGGPYQARPERWDIA